MRKIILWSLVSSVLGCVAPEESTVSGTLCTAEDQANGACPPPPPDAPVPNCDDVACESRLSLNPDPDHWEACRDGWICYCTVRSVRTACRYLLPGI